MWIKETFCNKPQHKGIPQHCPRQKPEGPSFGWLCGVWVRWKPAEHLSFLLTKPEGTKTWLALFSRVWVRWKWKDHLTSPLAKPFRLLWGTARSSPLLICKELPHSPALTLGCSWVGKAFFLLCVLLSQAAAATAPSMSVWQRFSSEACEQNRLAFRTQGDSWWALWLLLRRNDWGDQKSLS